MKMKALWVVVLALSMLACGKGKPAPIRLGIAAQQSISQVPVYLAHELGYFREAGLTVELAEFAGASKGMEALLGGSVDVVSGYHTQVLQVRAQGRKVESFLTFFDSLLVALAASPKASRKIEKIEDLRGAKVGVTTLGSATHQFLDFVLRRNGLKPDDVTPVAIGTASRAVAAMERGLVDAGVVTDFTIRHLEKQFGPVRLLADTRTRTGTLHTHGVDAFPGTVLFSTTEWLDGHPREAAALAAAVWRAVEWMKRTPVNEIRARIPVSHYGEGIEEYEQTLAGALPMLSRNRRLSAEKEAADVAGVEGSNGFRSLE